MSQLIKVENPPYNLEKPSLQFYNNFIYWCLFFHFWVFWIVFRVFPILYRKEKQRIWSYVKDLYSLPISACRLVLQDFEWLLMA